MPKSPVVFRGQDKSKDREKNRGTKQQRGYGGEWSRISTMKRNECPVCEVCGDAVATQVDHIIAFDGVDDPKRTQWTNLQSICSSCHSWKTNVAQNAVAKVYVVCGLPGSGKTTFCAKHKPVLAAVFDLDALAAALNPRWLHNSGRHIEVNALLGEWREVLVNKIAGSKFLTETWIILSDKEKAEQTALKLSGRLVICHRDGNKFTAQIQDCSGHE